MLGFEDVLCGCEQTQATDVEINLVEMPETDQADVPLEHTWTELVYVAKGGLQILG